MEFRESDKLLVMDEATIMFRKLADEYALPPAFTCIHATAFFIANIVGLYNKEGKKPPKELANFINKTYPKLLADHKDVIELQYLHLNTEGTA